MIYIHNNKEDFIESACFNTRLSYSPSDRISMTMEMRIQSSESKSIFNSEIAYKDTIDIDRETLRDIRKKIIRILENMNNMIDKSDYAEGCLIELNIIKNGEKIFNSIYLIKNNTYKPPLPHNLNNKSSR